MITQKDDLILLLLGISSFECVTRQFKSTTGLQSEQFGQGACKAVRLTLPQYALYDDGTSLTPVVVWYGDGEEQTQELLQNTVSQDNSVLIIVDSLDKLFVRTGRDNVEIRALVYR